MRRMVTEGTSVTNKIRKQMLKLKQIRGDSGTRLVRSVCVSKSVPNCHQTLSKLCIEMFSLCDRHLQLLLINLFYRQRSKGNVFTCLSVHRGVCIPARTWTGGGGVVSQDVCGRGVCRRQVKE